MKIFLTVAHFSVIFYLDNLGRNRKESGSWTSYLKVETKTGVEFM